MGLDYTSVIYRKEQGHWNKVSERSANIFKNIPRTIENITVKDIDSQAGYYAEFEYVGLFEWRSLFTELNSKHIDTIKVNEIDSLGPVKTEFKDTSYTIKAAPFTPKILSEKEFEDLKLELSEYETELLNSKELKALDRLKEEHPNKTFLDFKDFISNRPNGYIDFYVKVAHNHEGKFYNIESFRNLRKELESNYYSKIKEFHRILENRVSVDYLKLSPTEKENFDEEVNFKQDTINDLKDCIESCEYFENVLDYFSEMQTGEGSYDEVETVVFIYGTC